MNDDDLDNEVNFWRHMIEQWQASNNGPVPERMRDALDLAKSKYRLMDLQHYSGRQQIH